MGDRDMDRRLVDDRTELGEVMSSPSWRISPNGQLLIPPHPTLVQTDSPSDPQRSPHSITLINRRNPAKGAGVTLGGFRRSG